MRIIHVVRQFYPSVGGLENYVANLAACQLKDEHEVEVVTLNTLFKDKSLSLASIDRMDNGLVVHRIPFKGSTKYPIAPGVLKYLNGFDIINVHAVDFFADYLAIRKRKISGKLILTTHGGFFHTNSLKFIKNIFFNVITRFTIQCYDKVIACSSNDYNLFCKIRKDVHLIENGVNIDKFSTIQKSPEKRRLLYIGRIDTHKRIDHLIRLVSNLKTSGVVVNLRIAGQDWSNLTDQLKELSQQLTVSEQVCFLGKIDDDQFLKELSSCEYFISASEYEGFGISVVEALASGSPCILNDIESFRSFSERTNSVLLVKFDNQNETNNKVKQLLSSNEKKYKNLVDNAKKFAANYSWEKVNKKIFHIYTS